MGVNKLFTQLAQHFAGELLPRAGLPMPTGRARGGVNHRAVRAGVLFRRWQMGGHLPGAPGRTIVSWPAWTPRERTRNERLRAARAARARVS